MERVKYIDVLRGVTMLLVIYQHIRSYSIGLAAEDSDLASLFLLFRMPMFFFLSGYIAYKPVEKYRLTYYRYKLLTKAKVQLIPTVVFFIWLSLYTTSSVKALAFPGGYWFTVVLFEMFVIYFTCSLCSRYTSPSIFVPLIFIVTVILIIVPVPEGEIVHCLCPSQLRGYMRYFVLGIICRRYKERFISIINNNWFVSILLIVCVLLLTCSHLGMSSGVCVGDLIAEFVLRSALVITVFMFFYHSREYWASNSRIALALNFVGRRTLDLYMLHYFFLPVLPQLHDFFAAPGNEIIEFVFLMAITITIALFSLLASQLLRCSPFLGKWLFGAKPKTAC